MPPVLSSQMQQGAPQGAAEPPPPGLFEDFGNRVQTVIDEDPDGVTYRRHSGYEPLIEALRDRGVGDDAMKSRADVWGIDVPGTDDWDYRKIYDLARRNQIGDLKKDRAEFEAGIAARPGYQQRRAATERSGRWWLELPIGVVQSFQPEYGPLPALGLPSKTILGAAAREAAINVLFEGVEIARTAQARDTLGNPITGKEVAARVAMAAGGGALFGAGGKVLPLSVDAARGRFERLVADNWDKLPAGLRERWGSAANVDGTALPDIFEAIVGRDNMSLDEKGAVAVLRREAELDAVNPFRPDGAGLEAHNAAVQRNVDRVRAEIEGMMQPRTAPAAASGDTALSSGTVPPPATTGARATIKAKIGRAESPNDIAKNPRSTATGRYQFVSGTWLAYYKRRFGAQGLTDAQILAKRTDGQLQDVLMDDLLADNARFLQSMGQPETAGNLYLTHFAGQGGARKLLNAEPNARAIDVLGADVIRANPFLKDMTAADVIGWAARKMDEAPSAVGVGRGAGGVDPEAAVRAELADRQRGIDGERAQLEAERAGQVDADPVELEAQRALDLGDVAPMPELRRDQFPDDTSWRIAQAAVDAEALGLPAPALTRQSVWVDARDSLIETRAGEVPGALYHGDVGPIEVKWGEAPTQGQGGYGLAKIVDKHPEVLEDLPAILDGMAVKSRTDNRVVLESADHKAVVRLEWDGKEQTWLLSAYERKGKAPPQRTTDVQRVAARDGSPALEAGDRIAENAPGSNVGLPMERLWGADNGPRDAGGLTAAERASLDFDEPGLSDFVDPVGTGVRLDLDGGVHDLRAAVDAEDPLAAVSYATRDGAVETMADVLASIDDEAAALAALRGCL